jgi:hypothetical protein
LNISAPKPPRVRVMIGLTLFGLIHLLVQRKGWFYHVYPLAIGLTCWGAWSLASLPPWRAVVCLLVTVITPVWLAQQQVLIRTRMYHVQHSASAMQAALEDRLPRGARVQMLDSDYGAFLAMARAGMRQATPHIQWFSLVFAEDSVRHEFLAALEDNPPAAILLTNSQWPQPHGFDAADRWPKFAALLASRYVLDRSKNENGIAWRLYLRRASSWGWSRQVQRGTINHINPISATRMRAVPTPTRNNPTSGMSEPRKVWSVSAEVDINSLRSHSTVGKVFVDALGSEGWWFYGWGIWNPAREPTTDALSLRLLSHHFPKPPRLDRPSVLPWTIATPYRIADGSGGP